MKELLLRIRCKLRLGNKPVWVLSALHHFADGRVMIETRTYHAWSFENAEQYFSAIVEMWGLRSYAIFGPYSPDQLPSFIPNIK